MPSEKKNKKQKAETKAAASAGPIKPLAHYASDRLELTKQLFSCLKTKQIKSRLPPSLQNKSMERIQQICLDEILGVSTKRLISIINNSRCPENTDSDDSEVEHISLEEISSDSEAEKTKVKAKVEKKKTTEVGTSKATGKPLKTKKEMTMLELLELQARARAIRSQLALEPVTKIELDSDEEDEGAAESEKSTKKSLEVSKTISNGKTKDSAKKPETASKQPEIISKKIETSSKQQVKAVKLPEKPVKSPAKKIVVPAPKSKPVKLKRNYKTQNSETASVEVTKEPTPLKQEPHKEERFEEDDDDVINMDPSPETFFISDSDDEPPAKKTPVKEDLKSPEVAKAVEIPKSLEVEKVHEPEEGECSENSREASLEAEKSPEKSPSNEKSPQKETLENENDDDVVHLTSDTEIEIDHQSDKEEDEEVRVKEKSKSPEKETSLPQQPTTPLKPAVLSDDDVVEINNSTDDEMMNESDKSAGEAPKPSQTWEERWLSSSKTQKVLKTTQFASKVRGKIIKIKKTQKANEKKKAEGEKAMSEKVSGMEEGSLEQFKGIKDNSDSSMN